jgi:hypothetical protein
VARPELLHGPKVNEHQAAIFLAANEVGRLDIAVDSVVAVDIAEDEQHLLHHLPGLFFGKRPVAPHLLGKGDSLDKLLHQVKLAAFLEVGIERGDLRMLPQALQHLGFAVKQLLRQLGQLGRIFHWAQLLDHPPGLGGHVLISS